MKEIEINMIKHMTKEEFMKKASETSDWAPGWDAIDQEFARIYPNQKPMHFGTDMHARAAFGGNQYLDGYSVFDSPKGYRHIVTYGMSELYVNEELFGGEWNKWGYEMTMKVKADDAKQCMWAINLMAHLARFTYERSSYFSVNQYLGLGGHALDGSNSEITALIVVSDTEAQTQDTVYGKTEFLQLVGITQPELLALKLNPERISELIEKLRLLNSDLVTDMGRTESLIE